MPLTLVTGPANAEKVRHALEAQRAWAARDGLLVVPRPADVEAYRRELAAGPGAPVVFGSSVMAFDRLLATMARRAGVHGRTLGRLARERVAAVAVERARLRSLGPAAATPGFPRALLRLVDELEERRVDPGRWWRAVRAWAAVEPGRRAYAEDLGALYAAYRDAVAALGALDPPLLATAALDALRLDPGRWGGSPVVLYGFDDLTPLELDAVETLARPVGADVLVTLTYEPGRAAFGGRGEAFHALRALAADHVELPPRAEHYAPRSRAALHHLERGLFEADEPGGPPGGGEPAERALAAGPEREGPPGGGEPARLDPGDAVELLEGGGERAELELVAARVAALLRDGWAAEEIAVVLRSPADAAALVERVFAAAGVDVAVERRIPAGHTALGRAVVGLVRAALAGGTAADLLAWLRAPGHLDVPALADGLEARARRAGATAAAAARALWEEDHPTFPLAALDRLRDAAARGPRALRDRLAAETMRLLAAPHRRQARILRGPETLDARVATALRLALDELARVARDDAALWPAPAALAEALAAVEVPAVDRGRPGAVLVTSPFALRARRVRALFLCRVQEGDFPKPARPEPFLSDADRRALNAASGLRLRLHEDALDRERYLLYAAVSRPTERLALSWHAADEEGTPRVPSLFVADVRDLFAERLWEDRARRALGAVDAAPGPAARERPVGPLTHPEVLASLRRRPALSASSLENWAGCPVRWFVESLLRPGGLEPDPEPLLRGGRAHAILEEVLRELCAGGRRLTEDRLPEARAALDAALRRRADLPGLAPTAERSRSALRRLEADLWRELERHARAGGAYVPTHFELTFGGAEDERPAVALAGGELPLQGRIDRVDLSADGRRALVVDYKGRAGAAPQDKWAAEGRLQVGLYMLALERLLGVEAVGGLYQPLGAREDAPRGLLRDDADDGLQARGGDRVAPEAFAAVLAAVEDAAVAAAGELREGRLEPRPERCAPRGGCKYPTICRCEAS
jgi:RecB family exonuclease